MSLKRNLLSWPLIWTVYGVVKERGGWIINLDSNFVRHFNTIQLLLECLLKAFYDFFLKTFLGSRLS